MTRSDIVKYILADLNEDAIVVASTGFISREVFKQADRPLNFYMCGSMGNALSIGIGLALKLKQPVLVINGDGSALMSLGSMLTAEDLRKKNRLNNLVHYIIDNNCHESTGGQRTVSHLINFAHLFKNTIVYKVSKDSTVPPRITLSPSQITERFKNALLRQQEQQKISQ